MAGTESSSSDAGSSKKPPGLTELISRVLEQLSVSAWLPAAMLIGLGSLLVQMHRDNDLDVAKAVGELADPQSWGVLIILLFGLIMTTMVTQAFSFGIIRLLEGYWGAGRLTGRLVRRQAERAHAMRERTDALERELFKSAMGKLAGENPLHVQVWNEQLHIPKKDRQQTDKTVIKAANAIDWRKKGDPGIAARFYRSHDRQSDYPDEMTRMLPTRLGNVLRSSEERLRLQGHTLERFVMENYNAIPARLMTQHDQFRDRLDMYALLVLVFAALSVASVPLLWSISWPLSWLPPWGIPYVVLLLLAFMSYRAAIASARGYGASLLAMNRVVKEAADRGARAAMNPTPTVSAGEGSATPSPQS